MKYNGYEDLCNGLKDLPQTWYPALLITMVEAAYSKRVFVPGGASSLIRKAELKINRQGDCHAGSSER
jgi:hypothetical protein